MYGMNSSGPAAKALSAEQLQKDGFKKMPTFGWHAVNVPGAPAGWRALSERFGNLPFEDLFEEAIKYAEEGFPVSPQVVTDWEANLGLFKKCAQGPKTEGIPFQGLDEAQLKPLLEYFAPNGRAPKPGEIRRQVSYAARQTRDVTAHRRYTKQAYALEKGNQNKWRRLKIVSLSLSLSLLFA